MYYFAFSGVRDKESNHHHFLKFEYNYTLFSFYFLVSLLKHLPIWSPYGEIYQSKCFLHSLVTISICFKSPSDTIRRDKKNSFWRSHSFRWFRTFDVIREFPITTTLLSSLTVQILWIWTGNDFYMILNNLCLYCFALLSSDFQIQSLSHHFYQN